MLNRVEAAVLPLPPKPCERGQRGLNGAKGDSGAGEDKCRQSGGCSVFQALGQLTGFRKQVASSAHAGKRPTAIPDDTITLFVQQTATEVRVW